MEGFSGKGRLAINLSIFTSSFEPKTQNCLSLDSRVPSTIKSPRNFEGGVVGLGIVAAMNDLGNIHESFLSAKPCKASILAATSPRSNPIPIATRAKDMSKVGKCGGASSEETEMSESYTCVISHRGNNWVKKRVYFDDKLSGFVDNITKTAAPAYWVTSEGENSFRTADFLSSCYLCQKKLHGLDIFMYRGEKAFCSVECRSNEIMREEYKEKEKEKERDKENCGSEAIKSSPCSAPMLFFAGVAAA